MRRILTAGLLVLVAAHAADAAVQKKNISYKVGETNFVGQLSWDDAIKGKRPGVLVVHEWWGLNDYAKGRADQLASLGYVAFACDMYGEGKTTEHPNEAREMATLVRQNVDVWQKRAIAALDVLKQQPECDPQHLAAIGYCFGGSTALTLAYTGADLDAVVTFHGALPVPTAEQAARIKASILVCHGAQDTFIPDATIANFRNVLDDAHVDYEIQYYAGTKHSFTVKAADARNLPGMAYNKNADERSWKAMLRLFAEKFGQEAKPAT